MRLSRTILPLAALALGSAPAIAAQAQVETPAPQENAAASNAYIPFADHGGVWDWRADGTDAVFIQDRHRKWYRAELVRPSTELRWVQFIGIDTGPSGRLDKFGGIYVKGELFMFRSFEPWTGPLPWEKGKDGKDGKAATAKE